MTYDHILTDIGGGDAFHDCRFLIGVPCNIKDAEPTTKAFRWGHYGPSEWFQGYVTFDKSHPVFKTNYWGHGDNELFIAIKFVTNYKEIDLNDGWNDEEDDLPTNTGASA